MAEKAITLLGGRTVRGYELVSAEADFSAMMWTFRMPDDDTRVGMGRYLVIRERDLAPDSEPESPK